MGLIYIPTDANLVETQQIDTVKHVYKDVQNVGKSVGKAISSIKIPTFRWG